MSLSENPHETKPLTMSAEKWDVLCKIVTTARPGTKSGAALLATFKELYAVRAALAEAKRERDEATIRAHQVSMAMENFEPDHERALAAAQLNARTLREALVSLNPFVAEDFPRGGDDPRECVTPSYRHAYRLMRAALSAPADEAALREWGDDLIRAFAKGRMIEVGATETRPYLNAALGTPETHAKEG